MYPRLYILFTTVIVFCGILWISCANVLAAEPLCQSDRDLPIRKMVIDTHENQGRKIKVWLGFPESTTDAEKWPYLVFSHGAFSAPDRYEELLLSFVKQGYVVVAPWHIDSESIVKTQPLSKQKNWLERQQDMQSLLQLTPALKHFLQSQNVSIDTHRIGVMGHSYGAFTAQVFAGAKAVDYEDGIKRSRFLPGIKAVLAYSPPGPMPPFIPKDAWQELAVPSMVITGTNDILPGFIDDWRLHLESFLSAPEGDNWAFIGKHTDHYFGGVIGRSKPDATPQQEQFLSARNLSIAFMATYLKDDSKAHTCLQQVRDSGAKNRLFQLLSR